MKLQTLVIFSFLVTVVHAQRYPQAQGTLRSGGGFSFFPVETGADNSTYKLSITPSIGYFFSDNALGGLSLNYNAVLGSGKYDATLRLSPNLKYYFMLSKQKFITANFNYNFDLETTTTNDGRKLDNNPGISVGPGGSYFFTRRISVEGTLLYTVYFFPNDTHSNKFSFVCGFNVNLPQSKKGKGKFN